MSKDYLKIIEDELARIDYPASPSELYEPIRYILNLGGKRVRPVICLMAAELYEADIQSDRILQLAISLEIFHNFSLVHDDIMDEAPLRRGKPTVHQKWNRDIAILSGDVMLVQAYEAILRSGNPKMNELIAQFNRSAILVCEGQQYDMNYEKSSKVSIQDYLKMIGLKTAELIGCSLKLGAIAAQASEADANSLYAFGINLGLAFQIQDDFLDAFGDAGKVGKQVGGDILANKQTFLLLKSRELATDQQLTDLSLAMNLEGAEKVQEVLKIFEKVGVKKHTSDIIDEYYQTALAELDKVSASSDRKMGLRVLASNLMNRDH